MADKLIPCPDCGALVPDIDGPTHRYLSRSAGCWQAFNELSMRGYTGLNGQRVNNRLVVDIYCSQHPGVPSRPANQSVCAHLFVLCLALEHDLPTSEATGAIRDFIEENKTRGLPTLTPPASLGSITVLDMLAAKSAAEHDERLSQWAESVWQAWEPHHATVRAWVEGWLRDRHRSTKSG